MPTTVAADPGSLNARRLGRHARNDSLVDWWSAAHFAWALALGIVIGPLLAFVAMVVWEPIEILILGPLLARWNIAFGHESLRNSLSDVVFDGAGAATAFFLVLPFWDPLGVL